MIQNRQTETMTLTIGGKFVKDRDILFCSFKWRNCRILIHNGEQNKNFSGIVGTRFLMHNTLQTDNMCIAICKNHSTGCYNYFVQKHQTVAEYN